MPWWRRSTTWGRFRDRLRLLGRQHVGYGVTPRHYDVASRALLWTLGQAVDDFTDETREAWQAALAAITETMKAGAAGV